MSAPAQNRIIFQHIDEPGYTNDLACYLKHGGYAVMKRAFARQPQELIDEVKKSGLRGRGGAGFPCGVKWGLVDRKSGKPIYLIVNADESEPGTFKDRYIMQQDPHQLIEGTIISCFANNVKQAYIYIRGEMAEGARILEKAIAEVRIFLVPTTAAKSSFTAVPVLTSAVRKLVSLSPSKASAPTRASSPRISRPSSVFISVQRS